MLKQMLRMLAILMVPLLTACGGGGGGSTPAQTTTYTVTFLAGTGGSVAGSTTQTVVSGGTASAVAAVASSGYTFSNWTGTGFTTSTANPLTISGVTSNLTVTANFTAIANYTVTFVAGSGGTLMGTTTQTVAAGGSSSAVTAAPTSGYAFINWTGTGFTTNSSNPLTVTNVTSNLTLTANFAIDQGAPAQVIQNGGFEQSSPLIWQGSTGVIYTSQGTDYVSHAGTSFAYLGGYGTATTDEITQDVYLPSTATGATLTFWMKILTAETGSAANDVFTLTALDTSGTSLATLLTKSNVDASGYTQYTVNLSAYKGRILRLSFKSSENASAQTSFLVDDVALSLTVPQASQLAPVITSYTPTSGLAGETTVTVTGGNFFGLTGLTVGGTTGSYTLKDGTSLSFVIPAGVAPGARSLALTNAYGTGTSASALTVAYGSPQVLSFYPTQGPVGTPVVLAGLYLGYPGTTLTLNGQALTLSAQSTSQITFTVPTGASSGNLVLNTPGGTAIRTFTVTPSGATLDLHVEKVLLTQSTQALDNSVPIVAGKDGLVQVWVLANQANTATPAVQVTLYNGLSVVAGYPKTITATQTSVPLTLSQSTLTASWNLVIPGSDLTTPSGGAYSVQAVVDPAGAIAEADETNNSLLVTLTGTTVPIFKTTIFPVVLASGTGGISEANKADWVARLAKMYPVSSVDVLVGAAFTGTVSTLDSTGTGWSTLLADLRTKHQADGASDRYYYGAVNVSYSSGIAGLGYVPTLSSYPFNYRTAIGWDKTTGYSDGGLFPEVFAHETGHNMGRSHSPCGSPANPDPSYPYAGGLIGMWGYDTVLGLLKNPSTTKDIMAYCTPNWVSDYVYKGILNFRNGTGGFLKVGAEDAPLKKAASVLPETLMVRGILRGDGTVVLLPAFRTRATPSEPAPAGAYHLECLDAAGQVVHGTPLDLMEVGCAPDGGERHFVMALPLEAPVLDAITGLRVVHEGRTAVEARSAVASGKRTASAALATAAPEVRRLDPERVRLSWDATLHPAAMVRNADTGEVIAILASGVRELSTRGQRFEVVLSDGVVSRTHQLEAPLP